MARAVLTCDRTLTSSFRNIPLLDFIGCAPSEKVPQFIFNGLDTQLPHDDGVLKIAPYSVRKLETALYNREYQDMVIDFTDYAKEQPIVLNIPINYDELELRRLQKTIDKVDETWELHELVYAMPMYDEDPPYVPIALLAVEQASGLIIGNHLTHPKNKNADFQQYFIDLIKRNARIPKRVHISNRYLHANFEDILTNLGIKVSIVDKLQAIPDVVEDILSTMTRGM